jgi:hypothetical protein
MHEPCLAPVEQQPGAADEATAEQRIVGQHEGQWLTVSGSRHQIAIECSPACNKLRSRARRRAGATPIDQDDPSCRQIRLLSEWGGVRFSSSFRAWLLA